MANRGVFIGLLQQSGGGGRVGLWEGVMSNLSEGSGNQRGATGMYSKGGGHPFAQRE